MVVGIAAEHQRRVDVGAAVERDEERLRAVERLQQAHVVGQRDALGVGVEQVVVPGRARERRPRPHAPVEVQHGVVGLVGEGAEDLPLGGVGIAEHGQRLVGVAGEEHRIEALVGEALRTLARDAYTGRVAQHAAHRGRETDAVAERRDEAPCVLA